MQMEQERIRNFCIIAHIDHGKSTLADRLLEYTGALSAREMQDQVLDQMDLERERGITIKLQAVRLSYRAADGREYQLNLIDTPGHVDFSYEVSRSLAACEGALLVIDASQGIEAQTLANVYLALDHDLAIIPVINKIDLPSAEPDRIRRELEDVIGLDGEMAVPASAKTGAGVPEILERIVREIPPPRGGAGDPLRALIFDSHYDSYRGVIAYVRVMEGRIRKGMPVRLMGSGKDFEVSDVGIFRPAPVAVDELSAGEVGFIAAGIKNVKDCRVGDTVTDARRPAAAPLPGYRPAKPMVYCGLYPVETNEFDRLRDALEKLSLNDAALAFEPETSIALGFGFRCGFLGLLHMEIIQERLEREYGLELITTAPSVVYRVTKTNGEELEIQNPSDLPPAGEIAAMSEPYVQATIMLPKEFVGPVMELCQDRRGTFRNMEYISAQRVMLTYDMPLAEIIYDFFDRLKSSTRGYASLDYEFKGFREADLVRVDILVAGEPLDALSFIVHRDRAYYRAKGLVERLRQLIPRQLFEIPVQAAVGQRVIARETIKALRKNVLAKCYGGDVTRKRKLLEKQKEGKKRMKQVGNVEIPQEAFMAVLSIEEK
ncbi:MAG: translation elongation factor 4 [Thermoanaerobacterales bacterium]|nr:translation elongation factor 4 [Bacillota bacterium]MDI6905965.1 translation elongation factor 4 [Thermoanaerobacterales bacterium]